LIDFGFRGYDPEVGRWTQRDPLGVAGGLNLYAYCAADPVNLVDPWGLSVAEDLMENPVDAPLPECAIQEHGPGRD
jgi:uncharacterized protein RhaS with RHS repeats